MQLHTIYINIQVDILENATALGERTRVLHRQFYITGVLYVLTELEGHLVRIQLFVHWGREHLSVVKS